MHKRTWAARQQGQLPCLAATDESLPGPIYLTGECSSALDVARELAQRDMFPVWASVLSLCQSAGRGQMRRTWSSPAGNLYAALRLPLEGPFATTAAAPAIGALCAEVLSAAGFPVLMKWPNDIVQRSGDASPQKELAKVGGILLEESRGVLTAGIGLNVASCPEPSMLREGSATPAGILRQSKNVSIFTLWKMLAAGIVSCYKNLRSHVSWWIELSNRHLAYMGQFISLSGAEPERDSMPADAAGILTGISPSGAIIIETLHGAASYIGGSMLPLR